MRTVNNNGLRAEKVEVDMSKVLEACVPISSRRIVFYEPFVKSATFSRFINDGGSKFIKSMSFKSDNEPEKEVVKSLNFPKR